MNLKQTNKSNLIDKIKAFFNGRDWKKAFLFFGFIVLAFVLWLMQYYQQRFETEITVPVAYKNVPLNVVLNEGLPSHITVKLTDKGTTLLNYNLNRKDDSIQINLANIDTAKSVYYVDYSTLTSIVRNHLQTSTSIQNIYPEHINVAYNPLVSKEVPVILDNQMTLMPGFTISETISITPATVLIYGDLNTIDTIHSVKTEPLSWLSVNGSIEEEVNLIEPRRTRISNKKVQVGIAIEEYTEKTFSVPIRVIDVPGKVNVRFFPPVAEITGNILLKHYNQVKAEDFDLTIDYSDLKETTQNIIPLNLKNAPSYLLNYRITPEQVEFIIEQQ